MLLVNICGCHSACRSGVFFATEVNCVNCLLYWKELQSHQHMEVDSGLGKDLKKAPIYPDSADSFQPSTGKTQHVSGLCFVGGKMKQFW